MKNNNKKKNVYDYIDKAGNVIKKAAPIVLTVGAVLVAVVTGKGKDGSNKA